MSSVNSMSKTCGKQCYSLNDSKLTRDLSLSLSLSLALTRSMNMYVSPFYIVWRLLMYFLPSIPSPLSLTLSAFTLMNVLVFHTFIHSPWHLEHSSLHELWKERLHSSIVFVYWQDVYWLQKNGHDWDYCASFGCRLHDKNAQASKVLHRYVTGS